MIQHTFFSFMWSFETTRICQEKNLAHCLFGVINSMFLVQLHILIQSAMRSSNNRWCYIVILESLPTDLGLAYRVMGRAIHLRAQML